LAGAASDAIDLMIRACFGWRGNAKRIEISGRSRGFKGHGPSSAKIFFS